MTMRKPPVAILVPTYNGGRFLGETLASIEAQTYANLRILIRDDGSSDDSVEIAAAFAARDNRFTLVPGGDRLGAENNCTALVAQVDEPFMNLVMQDDPLRPRHVEKLVAPMLKDSKIVFATAARQRIDAAGKALPDLAYNLPLFDGATALDGRSVARHTLLNVINQIGEPTTAVVRSGTFDHAHPFAYGGRDFFAMSDVAMWLTLLTQGTVYYTSEVLSSFRQHDAQRSQDMGVHIQCMLEWAYLFESAVRLNLLDVDAQAQASAVRIVDWNQHLISRIAGADTRQYDHHVDDVLAAIGTLWSTMSAKLVETAAGNGNPTETARANPVPAAAPSPELPEVSILRGPEPGGALSVRVRAGWESQPDWMTRLAELADQFPRLAVSLPLSEDDNGTGERSATHLVRICSAADIDIDQSGDFSLDPLEPTRTPPMVAGELPFEFEVLDLIEEYLAASN